LPSTSVLGYSAAFLTERTSAEKAWRRRIFIRRGIHTGMLSHVRRRLSFPRFESEMRCILVRFIGLLQRRVACRTSNHGSAFSRGGIVEFIAPEGRYPLDRTICRVSGGEEYALSQKWRVRVPRPVQERLPLDRPLKPARGFSTRSSRSRLAAPPFFRGFGTGKTVTQQSLAKWCNAD
jgi:V/A-type H+-transporting ATPase subunit A